MPSARYIFVRNPPAIDQSQVKASAEVKVRICLAFYARQVDFRQSFRHTGSRPLASAVARIRPRMYD